MVQVRDLTSMSSTLSIYFHVKLESKMFLNICVLVGRTTQKLLALVRPLLQAGKLHVIYMIVLPVDTVPIHRPPRTKHPRIKNVTLIQKPVHCSVSCTITIDPPVDESATLLDWTDTVASHAMMMVFNERNKYARYENCGSQSFQEQSSSLAASGFNFF